MNLENQKSIDLKESKLTIEINSYKPEMEKRLMNNDFKYIEEN